jgi:hypothetical protein
MRAPSHIDFRTAVKMSQQAAIISGVPKLTPLPTYQSQIVDECWEYTPSPEPELRYTPEIEQDGFLGYSRGTTPQTPAEPFGYNEPLPILDGMDYLDCQPWSGDGLVPVGLGFADMELAMPADSWMTLTPEPEEMGEANTYAQNPDFTSTLQLHGDFDTPLNSIPEDWSSFRMPKQDIMTPDAKALDGVLDSGIVMQGEWTQPARQDMYIDMGNMVTSAPYVPKMQSVLGNAPVWEDVFMSSSVAY